MADERRAALPGAVSRVAKLAEGRREREREGEKEREIVCIHYDCYGRCKNNRSIKVARGPRHRRTVVRCAIYFSGTLRLGQPESRWPRLRALSDR